MPTSIRTFLLSEEGSISTWIRRPVADRVLYLASTARAAGLDGVVCSPHEAAALRAALGPDFVLLTPGIRFADGEAGDQKRVATPAAALAAGADYLVMGRPITRYDAPADIASAGVSVLA